MTRPEIQVCLTEKLETAWTAYHQKVLRLPSNKVYAMAHEIHATRTCFEELVYNAVDYYFGFIIRRNHLINFKIFSFNQTGNYHSIIKFK